MKAFWDSIKDWLDSPSGHIAVSLFVIAAGAALTKWGVQKGEELMTVGMTLLGRGMLGQNGTFRKAEPPKP